MTVVQLQPELRLVVADGSNSIGHFDLWLRAAATADQGRAALVQMRGLLPTSCVPHYGYVFYHVTELDAATGGGDATRCAVFVFETTTPNQLAVVEIPGLRPELVDTTAPYLIDMTAPSVVALIAELQSGAWCNPFGYTLSGCVAGLVEIRPFR